jgi:hypothetical protein
MLDTPIDVNKMLENIVITSSRSLNTIHSCKFTFILIGEHVVHKFYVHAICITNDKLDDLQSKPMCVNSCDLIRQLFSDCNLEPSLVHLIHQKKTLMGKEVQSVHMLNNCSHPLALTLKGIQLNLSINCATKFFGLL